ncbi:pseudouridine synthase [Bdellovibrionota bacterium FG-1]
MPLRILYQDPHLVAVDKPSGFHVHPPEDQAIRIRPSINCLHILGRQLDQYLYPVHRIDCATSGVLIFALDQETARQLSQGFQNRLIKKTYYCVVRGWMPDSLTIDRPLSSENDPDTYMPASTAFLQISQLELPLAIGQHPTVRYSLLQAQPASGRYHQIRRHLAGHSHPIIGDAIRGDGIHNRLFRDQLQIPSLLLKSQRLEFTHPRTGEPLRIESRWTKKWHKIFDLFGVCPVRMSEPV